VAYEQPKREYSRRRLYELVELDDEGSEEVPISIGKSTSRTQESVTSFDA
jgi:hypothetical protein